MSLTFKRVSQQHATDPHVFRAESPALHHLGDVQFGAAILADLLNVRAWCKASLADSSWTMDGGRTTSFQLSFDDVDGCVESGPQDTEWRVYFRIGDANNAALFANHWPVV
jgi:hypothetical protein